MKNLKQAKTLLEAAISLLNERTKLIASIETDYEKYKGLYRDESQLKYMGKLWKYYNDTIFEGKLPKFKSIEWRRQTSNPGALGTFNTKENSFTFLPGLFQLSFDKFKSIFLHEMCHQAQEYVGHPEDPNFVPYDKRKFGYTNSFISFEDPFSVFSGHGDPAWNYWTKKCGIKNDYVADVNIEEVLTDKNKERIQNLPAIKEQKAKDREENRIQGLKENKPITNPKKYMVVKFWNNGKWLEGMLVAKKSRTKGGEKWLVIIEKFLRTHQMYPIPIEELFEADPKKVEEILSNPKWKKTVNSILTYSTL